MTMIIIITYMPLFKSSPAMCFREWMGGSAISWIATKNWKHQRFISRLEYSIYFVINFYYNPLSPDYHTLSFNLVRPLYALYSLLKYCANVEVSLTAEIKVFLNRLSSAMLAVQMQIQCCAVPPHKHGSNVLHQWSPGLQPVISRGEWKGRKILRHTCKPRYYSTSSFGHFRLGAIFSQEVHGLLAAWSTDNWEWSRVFFKKGVSGIALLLRHHL